MMSLTELMQAKGHEAVAFAMSTSVRRLRDIARGRIALTVDDLFELQRTFGKLFDIDQTVKELGRDRERTRRARKFSPKLKPTLMTTLGDHDVED